VAGPLVDPQALVLAFRHGQWDVTTADRRTEWSYAAALDRVAGDPGRLAPTAAREHRPPPAYEPWPGASEPRPGTGEPRPTASVPRPTVGVPQPRAGESRAGESRAGESRAGAPWGPLTLPVAALILVMAAVMAGAGTWFAMDRASAARLPALVTSSVPASPSGPASPSAPARASRPASPSGPVSTPPGGLASLAPSAALYPDAGAIQGLIGRYFQAINGHDYAAYQATQSPGTAMTAAQFQAGFGSTRDSGVLITGITTGPDGRQAADVTFTSRQQPQDGPDGETCTNWWVTMYLDGNGGSYTIGAPPNGYKAAYQACPS
jgi:hypothetical protein